MVEDGIVHLSFRCERFSRLCPTSEVSAAKRAGAVRCLAHCEPRTRMAIHHAQMNAGLWWTLPQLSRIRGRAGCIGLSGTELPVHDSFDHAEG